MLLADLGWPAASVIIAAFMAFVTAFVPALLEWMKQRRQSTAEDLKYIRQVLDATVVKDEAMAIKNEKRWSVLFRFLVKLKPPRKEG
jgi:hypothetical protein